MDSQHKPADPLLNEVDAATHIGVKAASLQLWRCTGRRKLPYLKIGRLVRYRLSVLDEFLAACEVAQ